VLALLGKNLSAKPQARVHPVGVGKAGSRSLFYVPGASGTGSFEHNRAIHTGSSTSKKSEIEVSVDVVDNVAALTGRDHYDLVKIDVEGAEFEVLSQLDVSMRYLWIELSGRRFGDVNHHTSELYEIIRGRFGEFDILFHSRWDAGSTCDVLIEIAEKPAVVS
jgi:FkbM family methyltransferase